MRLNGYLQRADLRLALESCTIDTSTGAKERSFRSLAPDLWSGPCYLKGSTPIRCQAFLMTTNLIRKAREWCIAMSQSCTFQLSVKLPKNQFAVSRFFLKKAPEFWARTSLVHART